MVPFKLSSIGANRGIPNTLMRRNNQTVQINFSLVLDPEEVVEQFELHGGSITEFSPFGQDPLEGHEDLLQEREHNFTDHYTDLGPLFHTVVNGDYRLFHEGLLYLIDISKQLELSIQ